MGSKGPEGGRYGTLTYFKEVTVQSYGECAVDICTCAESLKSY